MKRKNQLAMLIMLVSTFFFCLMQVLVRISGKTIGTMQQVFFRNSISLLIALFSVKRAGVPLKVPQSCLVKVLGRALFGFLGVVTLFYASRYARQADVTILSRTSVFFVVLFSSVFLKEKISSVQVPAMLLCFAGAMVALKPGFVIPSFALICSLLDAIFSAVAYTLLASLRDKVHPLTIVFHFSAFSCLCAGLLMLPTFAVPNWYDLMLLMLIGVTAALGQIGLTYAYQLGSASEVSVYNYVSIPIAAILGFFLFQEPFTLTSILGGALVVASALWLYFFNQKRDEGGC